MRLAFALALSLVLYPLLAGQLPALPSSVGPFALLIIGEATVGVFLGTLSRITIAALHTAGTIVAFQTSLAYAQTVDPNQGSQGALIAAFFNLIGLTAVFVSGMHYMLLAGVIDSYKLFPPGQALPLHDFATLAQTLVLQSFKVGLQIASPFIVYGIGFYVGLGILQRLMPQLQLFFIVLPLQMIFGFAMLFLVTSVGVLWFLHHFESVTALFLR